ncbi:hypothetical protein [Mucilaginibacter paludis]|uniref:hypothetical protein n=1 Tax=Mucilaginibacter paludis TaxID=423351 RepID=UPI000309D24B|nr:hypothetical protein [Mucilaginibacter paludis]
MALIKVVDLNIPNPSGTRWRLWQFGIGFAAAHQHSYTVTELKLNASGNLAVELLCTQAKVSFISC